MGKIWIVAMALGALYGCGGNSPKAKTGTGAQTGQKAVNVQSIHNARTALDFEGTYAGTLPVAGGGGMTVTITLGNST